MLSALRRFAGTWPAKVFFVVLVASFGLWGVADVVRNGFGGADPNAVATVGGRSVTPNDLQETSRRMLAQYMRQTGATAAPSPEIRRAIAEQALQELEIQAAFANEVARLHLAVPDDSLRQATFDTKAFQGPNGQFDRNTFNTVLRNNGFTEARYLALLRTDLGQRQIGEALRAGGSSPAVINRLAFTFQGETRTADVVTLPFAAAPEPPAPTQEQIEREYDDNTTAYALPEQRRIKAVILSPEGVARDITISDADARAYYDSHHDQFGQPETRSVQVVVAPTEAAGRTLATAWIAGAYWNAIQKQAATAGASAVELDDQTEAGFPAPDLAKTVFAAPAGSVTGPVSNEGAWAVFRTIKVTPGHEEPFEAVAATIKGRMALDQATDQVYDRANKLQDALAGGAKLDDLPGDLGLLAVTGTLDASGNTADGTPAPIPGSPALREAVIKQAFAITPNDPPTLQDGPDHSFYAVSVESVIPPAQQPLDAVRDRVREDWIRDTRRHTQDLVASGLLTAVNSGTPLKDAAAAAHVPMTRSAPIGRGAPPQGIPSQLVQPLFATAIGHAVMVESPAGFVVAVPVADTKPDPAADPAGVDRVRTQLAAAMSNDLEMTYAAALRDRAKISVNQKMLDEMTR